MRIEGSHPLSGRRWLQFSFLLCAAQSMRFDPERIATRLRIEGEDSENPFLRAVGGSSLSRGRRQLATPKEISIQVTAPLFSSRLFDYGDTAGDFQVPASLDVGKKLQLKKPLTFFNEKASEIYILSNGGIAFDSTTRVYRANLFPTGGRIIAPFWNRNDLRNGGKVFYREVASGRVLERGQSEIRYQYDKTVKVLSAVVVTWENMQPLGAAPLPPENTNTFQAAIFITDKGTFSNFIYSNIGWTQGAEAGFNQGSSRSFYALPTSGTGKIMYLEEYGNTGIPGEWMFEIGGGSIIRCKAGIKGETCDEECQSGWHGADCSSCCHCQSGECNSVTGACLSAGCAVCWKGENCHQRDDGCVNSVNRTCAINAISFKDTDRCGDPIQRCQCLEGFTGDGYVKCTDVDECKDQSMCHPNAICTNTPGRYFCQCQEGFSGDGVKECVSSFFFPSSNHHVYSSTADSIEWKLRLPYRIFGTLVSKLYVTRNGIISVDGAPMNLSSSVLQLIPGLRAVAPLFHHKATGAISFFETTESDVLTKVTRSIQEATDQRSFIAETCLILTARNFSYNNAAILSGDSAGSVVLPGSGTDAIEQLSQLSNVGQSGVWIFRIDDSIVQPCLKMGLLPPYCENAKKSPSNIKSRPSTSSNDEDSSIVEFTSMAIRPSLIQAPPSVITAFPPLKSPPRFTATEVSSSSSPSPNPSQPPSSFTTPRSMITSTETRQLPVFQSTRHRSIIALADEDIENIPPDAFEIAVPPFVTVIPEIFTPNGRANSQKNRQLPEFSEAPSSTQSVTTSTSLAISTASSKPHKENTRGQEVSEKRPAMVSPDVFSAPSNPPAFESTPELPIFVFTTTTHKPRSTPKRPKIVTGPSVTSTTTVRPKSGNSFSSGDLEASASKLAIIIPAAIVVVWILLLVAIGIVVCCRKRNERRLRSSYGPSFATRGGYGMKRTNHSYDHTAYEDHLEKAARLSSEMTAYNQTGRVSLYGSYWNLNNMSRSTNQTSLGAEHSGAGSGSSNNSRSSNGNNLHHQHHTTTIPYTNPAYTTTAQRHVYTGRY